MAQASHSSSKVCFHGPVYGVDLVLKLHELFQQLVDLPAGLGTGHGGG
ncbi:MAG: hypothetical protein V3R80_05540 [Candidatus Tectomicrobia bacterium]